MKNRAGPRPEPPQRGSRNAEIKGQSRLPRGETMVGQLNVTGCCRAVTPLAFFVEMHLRPRHREPCEALARQMSGCNAAGPPQLGD